MTALSRVLRLALLITVTGACNFTMAVDCCQCMWVDCYGEPFPNPFFFDECVGNLSGMWNVPNPPQYPGTCWDSCYEVNSAEARSGLDQQRNSYEISQWRDGYCAVCRPFEPILNADWRSVRYDYGDATYCSEPEWTAFE